MAQCHEMKKGEVYTCPDCGIEVQVLRECEDPEKCTPGAHKGSEKAPECGFSCCGRELEKKQ